MTRHSQDIRQELLRIAESNSGVLKPEDVVHAAESVTSPLHSHFEWDDSKAAADYRLFQARNLIRVTVQYLSPEPTLSRVFVSLLSDRGEAGGGYRTMVNVLGDAAQRQDLLREALGELRRAEKKYGGLVELAGVWDALNGVAA